MNGVEFPSHRHPLELKEFLSEEANESRVCGLCGETVKGSGYECSQCDFAAHLGCAQNPPSTAIVVRRIHEHTLTLLPRKVSFTCNACGLSGDKSPYVCLECSLMTHKDCVDLPRVLKITRHKHRLFHTFFLGPGEWNCGICRHRMDGRYGAYSCRSCESYAVHPGCGKRTDVWDGKELDWVPEEENNDELGNEPLFCYDENILVLHVSHQHGLRLGSENEYRDDVCFGCALPIALETFFRCDVCEFFLHEICANHSTKKNTFLHKHPLTLCANERSDPNGLSRCDVCHLHFNGFSYRCFECKDEDIKFDIRCSEVSVPFEAYAHEHPLVLYDVPTDEIENAKICRGCGLEGLKYLLCCTQCSFYLCVACAALPYMTKYKYDEHLLSVHTSHEDVTGGEYLCDICEKIIEDKGQYYMCYSCGPVLHTNCAVGSFRHMRPGVSFKSHGHEYQVVLNDRTSQLCCSQCLHDCHEPLILMSTTDVSIYFCSSPCFTAYISAKPSLL